MSARLLWVLMVVAVAGLSVPALGARRIALPAQERWVMNNGLTVIVALNRELPLVSMRLLSRVGSVDDPAGREGLASLTATLLRRGASGYDAREFADAVDGVGGELQTGANLEHSYATAEFLARDLEFGLGLFGAMLTRPEFSADEVAREVRKAVAARRSVLDNPSALANEQMYIHLFSGHPYGHPEEGFEESIRSITRADVVRFYRRHWTAANSVLSIVGDLDSARIRSLVEHVFGDWTAGEKVSRTLSPPTPVSGKRVVLIVKRDISQAQIRICQVGISRTDADYFAVMVANTILGAGFTSWLMDEIRVNRGLSYGVSSRFISYSAGGLFRVSTSTKNHTTGETIQVALDQVARLWRGEMDDAAVQNAKSYIMGLVPLNYETSDDVARALVELEYYGQPVSWIEDYPIQIDAVTIDDVRRVARAHFSVDDLLFVVVANPDDVTDQLARFGSVTQVSPE